MSTPMDLDPSSPPEKMAGSGCLSFKARVRAQILMLRDELETERTRHKEELKLQREEFEHKLKVEAPSSVQVEGSITHQRVQLTEPVPRSTPGISGEYPDKAQILLRLKAKASELERWQTAFSHLSGTPEQRAATCKEVALQMNLWRNRSLTATIPLQESSGPSSGAEKAQLQAELNAAKAELKLWEKAFNHFSGTPDQRAAASKDATRKISQFFNEKQQLVLTQRALERQVRDLQINLSNANAKQLQNRMDAPPGSELHRHQELNIHLLDLLRRELAAREPLLAAYAEYQKSLIELTDYEALAIGRGIMLPPSPRQQAKDNRIVAMDGREPPPATASALSNKRKRDSSEASDQRDVTTYQRRRVNIDVFEGPPRRESGPPRARTPWDSNSNWRAPPASTQSYGRLNGREEDTSEQLPIHTAITNAEDRESHQLKRESDSPNTVRLPRAQSPVEKKWAHSMLKRAR